MNETVNALDPYKVLHVHRRAPLSLIVEAYWHLVHQSRQDAHASRELGAILSELNEAYHILATAEQREAYDKQRATDGVSAPVKRRRFSFGRRAAKNDQPDYYELLQVDQRAGPDIVEIAFGVLAQQASAGSPARMRLEEARRVLADPGLRAAYDASHGLSGSADAAESAHDAEIREEFLRDFGKSSRPDTIPNSPPTDDSPDTRGLHLAVVIVLAAAASIASLGYFYHRHLITAFADGESRLIMARMTVDSSNEGLTQLGGVWPPIPQVFMVPLARNSFLFHSGLAGSLVSMFFYVLAVCLLYKLLMVLTKDWMAAVLGVVAFSSPNLLYMQVTPMSEMPFIAFILLTAYCLTRWVQNVDDLRFLFLSGVGLCLATLTRYEGWPFLFIVGAIVAFVCVQERFGYHKFIAHLNFFGVAATIGAVTWLAWNQIIFGDVLFFTRSEFAAGPMAARAFASLDSAHQTAYNLPLDVRIWARTCGDIVGYATLGISAVGGLVFLFSKRPIPEKLIGISLVYPTFFYLITMYLGFSTVIQHPAYFNGFNWGTRYATLMLPAVGLFTGTLVRNWRGWLKIPMLGVLLASAVLTAHGGLLAVNEARTYPTSPGAKLGNQMAQWFNQNYDRGSVLLFRVGNERVIISSRIPISKYVFEGSEPKFWKAARQDPVNASIDWIVMRNAAGRPDQVWKDLQGTSALNDNYYRVYSDGEADVYKIKPGKDKKSLAQAEAFSRTTSSD